MSENTGSPETNNKSSTKNLLIILIIVVVIVGGAIGAILLLKDKDSEKVGDSVAEDSGLTLGYENNAVVITDEDELQKVYDEAVKKAKEGSMAVEFKPEAVSSDGINFDCEISNSVANSHDMYITIFKDDTRQEQIYLSGLIPVGSKIESFKTNEKLSGGSYNAVLMMTQVDDDHKTMVAQTSVYINLKVIS